MLTRWMAWLGVWFTAMVAATPAHAQWYGQELFDPMEVRSTSGAWSLWIDPSAPDGTGPAAYRLSRGKESIWSGELPCTLHDVLVGDDGAFAGTAELPESLLRLTVLGIDGKPRFEATLPYEGSTMHGPNYPLSEGLVLDREHDLLLFRVQHVERDNQYEEWRQVRWSSGEELRSVKPTPQLVHSHSIAQLRLVKPIAGLPLFACQWAEATYSEAKDTSGVRFVLTDAEAHPLWELALPNDYEAGGDEAVADRLWWTAGNEGIFAGVAPRRFGVQLVAEGQRVTFEVSRDTESKRGWKVLEVERKPHAFELDPPEQEAKEIVLPELAIELAGTIELQVRRSSTNAFREFDIDDRGRMGRVIGGVDCPKRFELRDSVGTVVCDVPVELGKEEEYPPLGAFWVQGDRWLVHKSGWGEGARAEAWWLDLPAGSLTALENFDCAQIRKGDGTFDGGFIVLTAESKPYTIETTLSSFDAAGKLRWRCSEAYGNSEDGLVSPKDVRVSPRGEIGVLDVTRDEIQRFSMQGKLVSAISLEELLGQEVRYPTDLGVDSLGNWIVYDSPGSTPTLRISREGALTATFTPHFLDGRVFSPPDGIHFAPDGRMWATDGYSFLRLDETGAVDHVAGEGLDPKSLGTVACSFVDSFGRIALADSRTHAVHVFDREGKQVALCQLEPHEVTGRNHVGSISVSLDGNFHVGLEDSDAWSYTIFDSSGLRVGRESFEAPRLFQPGSRLRWGIDYTEVHLYDGEGALKRTISRSPDNKWLHGIDEVSVAADGSLALMSRKKLHLYGPTGEPVVSLDLTEAQEYCQVALAGKHVYLCGGEVLWRIDPTTKTVRKTELVIPRTQGHGSRMFWQSAAKELWIVDEGTKRVFRYRVKTAG